MYVLNGVSPSNEDEKTIILKIRKIYLLLSKTYLEMSGAINDRYII